MAFSLVVLVGNEPETRRRIEEAFETGSAFLVAPTMEQARSWFRTLAEVPEEDPSPAPVQCGDLEIDLTGHRVRWQGEILCLTEREFQILAVLASAPGRAWSFGDLLERVWGITYLGDSSPVRSAIKRLRKKLAGTGGKLKVEAVRGVGFCLVASNDASIAPDGRGEGVPQGVVAG